MWTKRWSWCFKKKEKKTKEASGWYNHKHHPRGTGRTGKWVKVFGAKLWKTTKIQHQHREDSGNASNGSVSWENSLNNILAMLYYSFIERFMKFSPIIGFPVRVLSLWAVDQNKAVRITHDLSHVLWPVHWILFRRRLRCPACRSQGTPPCPAF